jgi:hypothetical protein
VRSYLQSQSSLLVIGACFPVASFAEVMDKEPSLVTVWMWALAGTVAGLLGARVRWWLLFVTLPLPLIFYYRMIFLELADEHVGAAIRVEAGEVYIYSIYVGLMLVLLGHILGFLWGKNKNDIKV